MAQLIAGRPELPEALYAPLFATRDPIVLAWLARRAPKFMAAPLVGEKIKTTPGMALEFLKDPELFAENLAEMVASTNAKVRAIVGSQGALDAASANILAQDSDADVRVATIRGQFYLGQLDLLSPETISTLVKDSAPAVRQEIAAAALSFEDFQALHTTLNHAGLAALAESLHSDALRERDVRMSDSERMQAIALLMANPELQNVSALFLALPAVEQVQQFDALWQARRLDLERVGEHTRSVEVLQKIVAAADQINSSLPSKLAANPKLPLVLQRLILERAILPKKGRIAHVRASPRGALGKLLEQDGTADEILLAAAKLPRNKDFFEVYLEALVSRRNLPLAVIEVLHARFLEDPQWTTGLLLPQLHINEHELSQAILCRVDDDAVQVQIMQAEMGAMQFWQALAKAPSQMLRVQAAANINTPVASLITLTQDTDEVVAMFARTHLNLPSDLRLQFALAAHGNFLKNFPLNLKELEALLPKLSGARRREAMRLINARR